jgi:hypothetical protein
MFLKIKNKARLLARSFTHPAAPIRSLETITRHIEKYFGSEFYVLDENVSSIVHIDVHVVHPTADRPFFTLLTSGMSDRDMQVPTGMEDLALAEVCLCLPPSWPLGMNDSDWREAKHFWPIAALKEVAKYPHVHQTWFSWGHIIGSVEHPEPIDSQGRFTGLILLNPAAFPEGADELKADDGRTIRYLAVVPLLKEEMDFKHKNDTDALEEKLIESGVTELLNPGRGSVV